MTTDSGDGRRIRARLVCGTIFLGLLAASCGSDAPTAPGTSGGLAITSIQPSPYYWSTATQTMTVTGGMSGLKSVDFTMSDGSTTSLLASELTNLTATSFQVATRFSSHRIGTHSVTVRFGLVHATKTFAVVERLLACVAPAPVNGVFDPRAPVITVHFVDGTNPDTETAAMAAKYGFTPTHVYHNVFLAFDATLTDTMMDGLRCEPSVRNLQFASVGGIAGS